MRYNLTFFCLCLGSLFAERQDIYIPREDGTFIEGYFDRPDGESDVPVVVFVDGSYETSVTVNHEKLAARFNPLGIGLISLEKRGVRPSEIDKNEFYTHDCFEERLRDHALLLERLESGEIVGSNGRVILLGGSEGGKIAPRLSLDFPLAVQGVVLIGSGGGMPFAEEMKYQVEQRVQQMGTLKRWIYTLKGALFPKGVEQYYHKMINDPESLKMCGPKTWKWFASYLRYDLLSDFLKIEVPIYLIHGEKDIFVPIQSADLIKEAFDQAGKTNLEYARYEDLEHSMVGREDVYAPMLNWISEKLVAD